MTTASATPAERARKMHSNFLQRVQGAGTSLSTAMGVSESTLSRLKNEHAESVFQLLAHAGLKVVDETRQCVQPSEIQFLRALYARVSDQAPWLLQEGDA